MSTFEHIQGIDRHLIPDHGVVPLHSRPEGPQPLVRETPPGRPYPVEALAPLKAAVQEVQASTGAPVSIPAQSALSTASLAVQGFADVGTLAGFSPTSGTFLSCAVLGVRNSCWYSRCAKPII